MTDQTPTTTDITPASDQLPETRDELGRFVKGVSGNPNGRPKGKKNAITELKQDLEIALRENLPAKKVQAVVEAMLVKALEGNVGAAKLILDKVMSNAREPEDVQDSSSGLKIVIENATFDALQSNNPPNVIDVTPHEVKNEQKE